MTFKRIIEEQKQICKKYKVDHFPFKKERRLPKNRGLPQNEHCSVMKKEKLKKRVFDTAMQIVEKEGVEHLNIRKIAELSACSIGSVYNAFENLQCLLLEINSLILNKLYYALTMEAEREIAKKEPLRSVLRSLGRAYIRFGEENLLLWKALFEHSPLDPAPKWYTEAARKGIYQICKRLADVYDLEEKKVKEIVGFFWAAIHGVSAILLNRKMEMVAELLQPTSVDEYIDYCLAGLLSKIGDERCMAR